MQVRIVAAGRLRRGPELDLVSSYLDRFARTGQQVGLTMGAISEMEPGSDGRLAELPRNAAGKGLMMACTHSGPTVSSDRFAELLGKFRDSGLREVTFLIGGPSGISAPILARAERSLSFGPAVFPHLLFRVLLAEQLYRAATILAGLPYHRA